MCNSSPNKSVWQSEEIVNEIVRPSGRRLESAIDWTCPISCCICMRMDGRWIDLIVDGVGGEQNHKMYMRKFTMYSIEYLKKAVRDGNANMISNADANPPNILIGISTTNTIECRYTYLMKNKHE